MKIHKTIKGVLIANTYIESKENVEMSYCISFMHFSLDLWNFNINTQAFPKIKQTNELQKKQAL